MNKKTDVTKSPFKINGSENVYRMTSPHRGLCLIINNVIFTNSCLGKREGSDFDAQRLESVFKQLSFTVIPKRNLTTQGMRSAIAELAADPRNEGSDALVLIILSHGDKGFICGSDFDPDTHYIEDCLTYEDIVDELNNYNCSHLKNKPKMCFFQACKGELLSVAVDDNISKTLPMRRVAKNPEVSDLLLSFAAQDGFTTSRYEEAGGVYAYHLAHVLMDFAWRCDLQEMLGMVERRVRNTNVVIEQETTDQEVDGKVRVEKVHLCLSTSIKLFGWAKKLYFNPTDENEEIREIDLPTVGDLLASGGSQLFASTFKTSGTKSRLWVVGGGQLPEFMYDHEQCWMQAAHHTELRSDHLVVANSTAEQAFLLDAGGIYSWNFREETVSALTRLDPPRRRFAHAFLDGKIYVMGGVVNGKVDKSCRVFNIETGRWSDLNEMTRVCVGRSAVVMQGKIYITPGRPEQDLNKLDMLDPATGCWTQVKGFMKVGRSGHAIAACENYIWVFGGISEPTDSNQYLQDVERYYSGTWETMAPMPTARADLSVSYFGGLFYAIGGRLNAGEDGKKGSRCVEVYNPNTNIWTRGPSLQLPHAEHTSAVL